ncbi:MAG TPA: nuclear transport factor 2 family protein [Propionibacteriaceae bacterium]
MRLLEAFYQAQAAFYAGGDDAADLRGLLADDIAWHVPGAGHYRGHQEVWGYFGARRAHAKATFRVRPRAILADDQQGCIWPTAHLERDGQLRTWQTVGVFRTAGGKIAECWLVPFDQYLFDELWS